MRVAHEPFLKPQVSSSQYSSMSYLTPSRMASYAYQLREILSLRPNNVLEVGIGSGLVASLLEKAGIPIIALDLDPALGPDIVASVTSLPFRDDAFDVVGCFEVLEHIPWELVPSALKELQRVCSRYTVISVPDARPTFRVHLPILLRNRVYHRPFWRPGKHVFDGEHYWEINKLGYRLSDVLVCLERVGFTVKRMLRPFEASHQRFLCLEKSSL